MLNKKLLGYLTIKGEVGDSADCAAVSQAPGDSGGWSYGLYQLASNVGSVQRFIEWMQQQAEPLANYGRVLVVAGDPTCDDSFVDKWRELGVLDPNGFGQLQDQYAKEQYYDAAAQTLLDQYDFDIEPRSLALKQALFANAVQHGPVTGAEAFFDGAQYAGSKLNDMTDREIIWNAYEVKINDPSWSSGAPQYRPGLFARWDRERAEAIELLESE